MELNSFLTLVAGAFMAFGFQTVVGQDLSYWASSDLSAIHLAKSDIERGNGLSWQYDHIKRALSKEIRKAYFESQNYEPHERKALDAKLDELAVVATKFNISLESMEEATLFANNPTLKYVFDEMSQVYGTMKNFSPAKSTYYVSVAREEILKRAISPKEREKWAKDFFSYSDEGKDKFYEKLDKIAALAVKVIPTLTPNQNNFAVQNAAEIALIKKQLNANVKIHQIGLGSGYTDWKIQYDESKLNPKEFPQKRFKQGFAWIKDPANDFSYCELVQINLIQDYQGGGKFGTTKAVVIDRSVYGCPK